MRKKSGPWFCPKIVNRLPVDYSYSSTDDEDCSLQTIEEDDEDALDADSNPPIDEVTDDLEQLHTSQQKDFSQMNEASSTSIDSLAGPPLPPSVRILSEIGQTSKAAMDTSNGPSMDFPSISCPFEVDLAKPLLSEIKVKLQGNQVHVQRVVYEKKPKFCSICWAIGHQDSNCRRSLKKVWVPKTQGTRPTAPDDSQVHDVQGEKEFSNVTGMHPNSHLDNHEQALIPFSDPMITLQGDRNDIAMDMAAGCSDPKEQHSPENDNLNPVVAVKETSSLQPDGF
ncbi:hypothetical protein Dimus_033282 [Dionaea muscipula]